MKKKSRPQTSSIQQLSPDSPYLLQRTSLKKKANEGEEERSFYLPKSQSKKRVEVKQASQDMGTSTRPGSSMQISQGSYIFLPEQRPIQSSMVSLRDSSIPSSSQKKRSKKKCSRYQPQILCRGQTLKKWLQGPNQISSAPPESVPPSSLPKQVSDTPSSIFVDLTSQNFDFSVISKVPLQEESFGSQVAGGERQKKFRKRRGRQASATGAEEFRMSRTIDKRTQSVGRSPDLHLKLFRHKSSIHPHLLTNQVCYLSHHQITNISKIENLSQKKRYKEILNEFNTLRQIIIKDVSNAKIYTQAVTISPHLQQYLRRYIAAYNYQRPKEERVCLCDEQLHAFMTFLRVGMYQSDPRVDPKLTKIQMILNVIRGEAGDTGRGSEREVERQLRTPVRIDSPKRHTHSIPSSPYQFKQVNLASKWYRLEALKKYLKEGSSSTNKRGCSLIETDLVRLLESGSSKLRESESKSRLCEESAVKRQNALLEKIVMEREEKRSQALRQERVFQMFSGR